MTNVMLNMQLYQTLVTMLSDKYEVSVQPPYRGKDCNDYLCMSLGSTVLDNILYLLELTQKLSLE